MFGRQRLGTEDKLCDDDITRPGIPAHGNDWRSLRNTDGNLDRNAIADSDGHTDGDSDVQRGLLDEHGSWNYSSGHDRHGQPR